MGDLSSVRLLWALTRKMGLNETQLSSPQDIIRYARTFRALFGLAGRVDNDEDEDRAFDIIQRVIRVLQTPLGRQVRTVACITRPRNADNRHIHPASPSGFLLKLSIVFPSYSSQ